MLSLLQILNQKVHQKQMCQNKSVAQYFKVKVFVITLNCLAISIPNLQAIEERTCSGFRYSPSISDDFNTSSVKVGDLVLLGLIMQYYYENLSQPPLLLLAFAC